MQNSTLVRGALGVALVAGTWLPGLLPLAVAPSATVLLSAPQPMLVLALLFALPGVLVWYHRQTRDSTASFRALLLMTAILCLLELGCGMTDGKTLSGEQGNSNALCLTLGLAFVALCGPSRAAAILVACATIQAAYTIFTYTSKTGGIHSGTVFRAGGTLEHPSLLYFLLLVALPFALTGGVTLWRKASAHLRIGVLVRCVAVALPLTLLAALLLTWYRAGLLAAAIALTFAVWRLSSSRTLPLMVGVLLAVLVFAGGMMRSTGPENQISAGYSLDGRRMVWAAAGKTLLQHSIQGVGLNRTELPLVLERYGKQTHNVARDPMNLYLVFPLEMGLAGLVFLVLFIRTLFRKLTDSVIPEPLGVALQAAWIAIAVAGLFEVPVLRDNRIPGTLLLGALLGITLLHRPETRR